MPQAHTITDAIAGMTPAEKATTKATALASIIITGVWVAPTASVTAQRIQGFTIGGVTIAITSCSASGQVLAVGMTAHDAAGPLPLPDGGIYRFINPPVMARIDEFTATEDIVPVVEHWLYESVVTYARNHGWNG